jgi:hypothetical protein
VGALFLAYPTPEIPAPETGTEAPDIQLSTEAADFLRKLALTTAFKALRKTSRTGTDSGTGVGTVPDTEVDTEADTAPDTESGTEMVSLLLSSGFRFVPWLVCISSQTASNGECITV